MGLNVWIITYIAIQSTSELGQFLLLLLDKYLLSTLFITELFTVYFLYIKIYKIITEEIDKMGMFLNYQNIADNYMPNNLVNAFPTRMQDSKLNPLDASKPFEEYNSKGELIGYFWRYGETLNLEFNIDGEVTIEADALLFKTKGQSPTVKTMGKIGQRLYNIIDLTSWTCIAITNGNYIWQQDAEFTYPLNSDRSVYISAEDYLKDKNVEVTLYNFRMEPICKKLYDASPTIVFSVDKELSAKLVKGIYFCSVSVFNEEVSYTIFDSNDCNLLVK